MVATGTTPCCGRITRGTDAGPIPAASVDASTGGTGLISIAGRDVIHGTASSRAVPGDGEGPALPVFVSPFRIAPLAVTVSDFDAFVSATGHVTTAEEEGWSFVMAAHIPPDAPVRGHAAGTPWWLGVDGAHWRAPFGPGSNADASHPVVHVSLYDALTYCAWLEVRLPTEVEWEHAARGGLSGMDFPWGNDESEIWLRANVWRGDFPASQSGFRNGTCPVDSFAPTGFGLYNVIGTVWEWTSSTWTAADHAVAARGGSYLCHASYCRRYRVSARSRQVPDSTAGNLGFRIAGDPCPVRGAER